MNTRQINKAQDFYRDHFGTEIDAEDIKVMGTFKSVDDVYDAEEAGTISAGVADACDWGF